MGIASKIKGLPFDKSHLNDAAGANSPISKIWVPTSATTSSYVGHEYTFDEISTDAEKMLEFATLVRPLFKPNKEAYILGIDSTVNFLYQAVFQAS